MAANPKTLRIVAARPEGASARVLEIESVDGSALSSSSGKYIIVDTGVMSGDRPVKRAYSLIPVPESPHRARLIVKRIGEGSRALHAAPVGTELSFSGPWGKLLSAVPEAQRTLVVATDTGITTALGLVAHAETRSCRLLEVLWLRAEDETFLEVDDVRQRVEAAGVRFLHAAIAPARAPNRLTASRAHIEARVKELGAELVLAAGDGDIVHPLRTQLDSVRDVRIECFFHNPERKVATVA
ncbi:MAG TPA: FAD-binding oxidoreductase [Polyangiaceae bacterium]|nr:FAD-binding oxidoreductase [Polyangiaceae bacterium]